MALTITDDAEVVEDQFVRLLDAKVLPSTVTTYFGIGDEKAPRVAMAAADGTEVPIRFVAVIFTVTAPVVVTPVTTQRSLSGTLTV